MRRKQLVVPKKLWIFFVYILVFTFSTINCSDNIINSYPTDNQNSPTAISPPIEPYYPIPSPSQLKWENSKIAMFIHFGINTFTNKEWGDGTDDPKLFNPTHLDAEQWLNVAKEIGFKYVILTVKHHDGFCLWPSKYTSYSVASSLYKNGNGDVVKEFSKACHKYGLRFSFYLSPWDRHEPTYGTNKYNQFFQNQLIELLTNYGKVGEIWFDEANGDDPNGNIQYNWDLFFSTIRNLQPSALIASYGPDIRWAGNEKGVAPDTNWCIQPKRFSLQPSYNSSRVWSPTECDVSIRPGWFYHKSEDSELKSPDSLVSIYFASVGRNSNLLLNVPPNKEGLISDIDIQTLKTWKNKLDIIFSHDLFLNQNIKSSNIRFNFKDYSPENCLDGNINTFWVTDKGIDTAQLVISLSEKRNINIIKLEEAIRYGQRIKSFAVYGFVNNSWVRIYQGVTIGRTRLIKFNTIYTDKIKVQIKDSYASPTLRTISGYYYANF